MAKAVSARPPAITRPFATSTKKAGDPIAHVGDKISTPGENALMRPCCSWRSRGPSTRHVSSTSERKWLAQEDSGMGLEQLNSLLKRSEKEIPHRLEPGSE